MLSLSKKMLFLAVLVLSSSCALFAKEDTTSLILATNKLKEAKELNFKNQTDRLVIFKNELTKRALGEIKQGVLDDLRKAASPTFKTVNDPPNADGTPSGTTHQEEVKGELTLDEANLIYKNAADDSAKAIKTIDDMYEASSNLQAERDFNELFGYLNSYWLMRLSADQQQQVLVDKLTK